jgi:hypothetical protein
LTCIDKTIKRFELMGYSIKDIKGKVLKYASFFEADINAIAPQPLVLPHKEKQLLLGIRKPANPFATPLSGATLEPMSLSIH